MSDLTLNTLSFSSKFYDDIVNLADSLMDNLSMLMQESFQVQMDVCGNGTTDMQKTAKKYVREISRVRTATGIELTVGVDPSFAQGNERDFVRVSVVLFGNQAGGRLKSKPGQQVWDKGVYTKGLSNAKTEYPLPDGFNQYPVVVYILDNVMNYDMTKHIKDYIDALENAIGAMDFSVYLEVR